MKGTFHCALILLVLALRTHLHAQELRPTEQHPTEQRKIPRVTRIRKYNLGSDVNSPYAELAPIISPDGLLLFFTMGEGCPDNLGDEKHQDCYVARKLSSGRWSVPHNLGPPINSIGNDAISGVSPDGNVLFIKNYTFNHLNGLCFARRTAKGWKMDSITIESYSNNSLLATQSISADARYIIFSADRKDGYGGADLYVSTLIDRAKFRYGPPQNLGPVINTNEDEFAPFLATDGKTLYFSSKGLKGYGDADVFVAKRLDDSWVNWTYPKNLGPEINTPGMDAYYSIPASGDVAYYSSANGENHMDLYMVTLTEDLQPNPVILVTGRVISPSGASVEATVSFTKLMTDSIVSVGYSNPVTGHFAMVLPMGEKYSVRAEAPGYLPYSDNLDLTDAHLFREIVMTINLDTAKRGGVIELNNIFFDFDQATLRPESHFELDKLYDLLAASLSLHARIEGHTDSLGTQEHNDELSKGRAQAVVNYLHERGISSDRLSALGFGSSEPVATNATEEGRKKNRRVVFRIIADTGQ